MTSKIYEGRKQFSQQFTNFLIHQLHTFLTGRITEQAPVSKTIILSLVLLLEPYSYSRLWNLLRFSRLYARSRIADPKENILPPPPPPPPKVPLTFDIGYS